jgi:NAD(P)H dehydrogenase (quinone)
VVQRVRVRDTHQIRQPRRAAQAVHRLDRRLWLAGALANKPVTSFTSAMNRHGGQESTILALNNVFYHWGSIIVPPGYTDSVLFASGGNPYGTSWPSGGGEPPDTPTLASAHYQGRRLASIAARLQG